MDNLETDKDLNLSNKKKNIETEVTEESITRQSRKFVHNKRKFRNKDKITKITNKKLKLNNNSKTKNKNIYTKRTDLIQERIKIIQLAKKNIEDEEEANQKTENSKNLLENNENQIEYDKKTRSDEKNEDNNEQNDIIFKTLKTEGINGDHLFKKFLFSKDKYIKKKPSKIFTSSSDSRRPKIFKKFLTSTFFYKKDTKTDDLSNKEDNHQYNNNTYGNQKDLAKNETQNNNNIQGNSSSNTNDKNNIEIIGYKTGFIYKNKKPKALLDLDLKDEHIKTNNSKNEFFDNNNVNRQKPAKTFHKKNYSISQLSKNHKDIKEIKAEYTSENEDLSLKKRKLLNKIYVPKRIHHLIRGCSQENILKMNSNNALKANLSVKNRYKSYKSVNNITSKNNNINININNNIKIITYNKKKKYWKMDKKDNIIEISDDKIDEKFDVFKDNISDISSIESRSNVESETTENNNKLNVYLNNIYKTKAIFHPKLYKKKQSNTVTDKVEGDRDNVLVKKNSFIIEKYKNPNNHETNDINNVNKNSRNVSVPQFIFKKRITKDSSEFKYKSKNKNINININTDNMINNNYLNTQNNINNIKVIKNESELRFDELFIIEYQLKKIIDGMYNNKPIIRNLCFDFLNYFNESSILSMIEELFDNKNLKIIIISLKYLVFSAIVLYNNCSDPSFEENEKFLVQEIFSLNIQNILYLYEYIISKVKSKNIWANNIKIIIHNYKKIKKKMYSSSANFQSIFDKIKNNSKYIRQITNRIFISNKNTSDTILSFFKELEKKEFPEIKNFFIKNIYKQNKIYGYLYPFYLTDNDDNNNEFIHEKIKYDNENNTKKYTLFLGLEDILLNLKLDNETESKGTLILRPGLIPFLKEIHKFYEIIIFSLCEKKVADYLINSIEKRNQFFDYKLYRENFSIVNDEFVLDLNQINRPLNKILIISNIPQIYQLHKDNAIYLQSYWEENIKDKVMGQLMSILRNIADEDGDIREILLKYKDTLVNHVILQ